MNHPPGLPIETSRRRNDDAQLADSIRLRECGYQWFPVRPAARRRRSRVRKRTGALGGAVLGCWQAAYLRERKPIEPWKWNAANMMVGVTLDPFVVNQPQNAASRDPTRLTELGMPI